MGTRALIIELMKIVKRSKPARKGPGAPRTYERAKKNGLVPQMHPQQVTMLHVSHCRLTYLLSALFVFVCPCVYTPSKCS